MSKFIFRRNKAPKGLFRDDESIDISTLTSPNLHTSSSSSHQQMFSSFEMADSPTIPNHLGWQADVSHSQRSDGLGIGLTIERPSLTETQAVSGLSSYSSEPTTPLSTATSTPSLSDPLLPVDPSDTIEWAKWTFEREMQNASTESSQISDSHDQSSSIANEDGSHVSEAQSIAAGENTPISGCPARQENYSNGGIAYVFMRFASIVTTLSILLWNILAFWEPNWGVLINQRHLSLSGAIFWVSFISKFTEVFYLGLFGLFVGQIMSESAHNQSSQGVTLADFNIRLWITRPGVLLTNFKSAMCAFKTRSVLSVVSLLTVIAGLMYTSSSNTLVSPKLAYSPVEYRDLHGRVQASYANPTYMLSTCQSPITFDEDPEYGGVTCLGMEHVGQAYYNYLGYTQTWAQVASNGGTSTELANRPPSTGQLYGNTSVQGSWIETAHSNMSQLYSQYGRIIQNVSVAMPHPGVLAASQDPINGISQPEKFGGAGEYIIHAAVPSPALNVICVNMALEDIAPLVYTQWPYSKTKSTGIPGFEVPESPEFWQDDIPKYSDDEWLNRTSVDDIFGFGEKYGRRPPVFENVPIDYNTVANTSMWYGDSTYVLLKSYFTSNYTLCGLKSFLYPNCTTVYSVAGATNGKLQTSCDSAHPNMEYRNVIPDAPIPVSMDWPNVASEWALALSLNEGVVAGNASNPRQLTQLIPIIPSFNPSLPSTAEALANLAGCTLLLGATGSPFVHYWQYEQTILEPAQYGHFSASLQVSQYRSTHNSKWQGILYVFLVWTLLTSAYVTYYFMRHTQLITDYTEAENMLAIGLNSPTSDSLAGSCGSGPDSEQVQVPIWVVRDESSGHYYYTETRPEPQDDEEVINDGKEVVRMGILRRVTMKSFSSISSFATKRADSFV